MNKILSPLYALLAAWLLLAGPMAHAAQAQSPTEALKVRVDKVIEILRSDAYRTAGGEQKKQMLLGVTEDFFSQEEIARRTLAVHWKKFSPEQRTEFTKLFKQLLEKNYFAKIRDYTYKNETVTYAGERIEGNRALVQTTIASGGKNIPVDYSMVLADGRWQVYDATIEGVSLVMNYRTQFSDLLNKESPDAFLNRLRDKVNEPDQPAS